MPSYGYDIQMYIVISIFLIFFYVSPSKGLFALEGMRYTWTKDEVQTARMLFYLRVLPTCISLIPASLFGKLVAPIMFLYPHLIRLYPVF